MQISYHFSGWLSTESLVSSILPSVLLASLACWHTEAGEDRRRQSPRLSQEQDRDIETASALQAGCQPSSQDFPASEAQTSAVVRAE